MLEAADSDGQLPVEMREAFTLVEADRAPAPGQAVVFDRGGVVLGGGRLVASTPDVVSLKGNSHA